MLTPEGRYDARYLRGIERFNCGEYFECHEVWEELWREAGDPTKTFLKGLIQAAVALHHRQRGNRHGAEKLLASSRACLQGYGGNYLGLNAGDLLRQVSGCVQEQAGAGAGPRPRIVLVEEDC